MPIKNYSTIVPANQSISEIQDSLVKHGATGIMLEYESGTGRIESLKFILPMRENTIQFQLPVNWRRFQAILQRDNVRRCDDENYVYRVAWRNIRDWVMSQMVFYETSVVDLEQIFLPYAVSNDGQTVYEKLMAGGLLLGSGK